MGCPEPQQAAEQLPELDDPATLYADSGIENVNGEVDDLLDFGKLRRVLAQVEVSFSNSMMEVGGGQGSIEFPVANVTAE